jgi:hypothetical protein
MKRNSDTVSGCSVITPAKQLNALSGSNSAPANRLRVAAVVVCNLAHPSDVFRSPGEELTMSARARSAFDAALSGAALGFAAIAVGLLALGWWMLPL